MAGMVADYMTIKRTQAEYQKENIQYNRTAMAEEIKRLFPNDTNINVDDPKYANIVKDLPYAPTVMGGLAESFGIARASLSTDLWEDLSHGYIPVDRIPANSDLHIRTVDTPRGKLVACNQTSSPMDTTGKYQSSGKSTAALEFVFGLGGNINKTLARMASKDPSVNKKIKKITDAIFENYIVPKMLEDAKVRHGAGGLDLKPAKEISAVSFFHIENRSVEPYYHFHFDLMNMARGYDGNLNALATGSIAKEKDSYNYLFQSEMKLALEKEFGFVFEAVYSKKDNANENLKDHEKNIVSFDLSDEWVPENVRQYYSQRSEEMDKAKNGKEGFIAEELARLKSRAGKSHLSPSEMFEMWNKEMDTMGWSIDDVKAKQDFNYRRPNVQSVTDEQLIDNYLRKVHNQHTSKYGPVQCFTEPQIAQLTLQEKIALASGFSDLIDEEQLITNFYRKHGEISFSESQFKSHIARQLLGDFDKDLAFRHAERMFNEQCVQLMDKSKIAYYESFIRGEIDDPDEYKQKQIRWNSELQFTTKSVLNKERYISESLLARTNETAFIFDREEVKNFIMKWEERKSVENGKPFAFKDGQKNAIIVSLTEPGAYANISGRAGSGKSTLLECIKDFIEPKGFNVFGTSISSTATENVQEAMKLTDVNARNVAKTIIDIESGKLKFTNKTLIVIDEMGMIDLDQAYKLIKYANESGAKILGCGEKEQLQSVGYGSTYRILNDQFITAEVKEINRQADDWQRQMVEKFAVGNSKGSMQDLFKNGKIIIEKTADDATQKLVSDYIADTTNGNNKLILTSTNWDRNRINEEVRKELKTQGKLSIDPKNAVTIECRDKEKREFVIGDRVVFTKNFKSSDNDKKTLKNSQTGELIGFRMSRFNKGKADAMIVKLDNGKETFIKVDSMPAIDHGYASTTHRSQGATKWNTYWYISDMQNLHSAYVSASRHINDLKLYFSEELEEKWADKMEGKEPTAKMIQVAEWIAGKEGKVLAPEILSDFVECRAYLNQAYMEYDKRGIEPPNKLDNFVNLIESFSKTAYKKSTYDYQVVDGEMSGAYQHIKELRKDMIKNPELYKEEREIIVNQPKIVEVAKKETEKTIENMKKDTLLKKIDEIKPKKSVSMEM